MRESTLARCKTLAIVLCVLIGCNFVIVAALGEPILIEFGRHTEVADTGTSIVILWTRSGGSSIAWDCLPGIIPQFSISPDRVFIDFPLWILFFVFGIMGILTVRVRSRRMQLANKI